MSMLLQQFLARIAIDPKLLASYNKDPDRAMREAGLGEADQAALKSGNIEEVVGRISQSGGSGGEAVVGVVSHAVCPPGGGPVSHAAYPMGGGTVSHVVHSMGGGTVSHVVHPMGGGPVSHAVSPFLYLGRGQEESGTDKAVGRLSVYRS